MPKARAHSLDSVLAEGSGVSTPDPSSSLLAEKPKGKGGKKRPAKGGKKHGTGGGALLGKIATWVFSSNSSVASLPENFKKYSGMI